MGYEIDHVKGEKEGCSSRLTIEDRIFYIKLFQSPTQPTRYFAGDQKGVITKEISQTEFEFWIKALSDKQTDVEEIERKLGSGKRYVR
jgi:hypothetical protein